MLYLRNLFELHIVLSMGCLYNMLVGIDSVFAHTTLLYARKRTHTATNKRSRYIDLILALACIILSLSAVPFCVPYICTRTHKMPIQIHTLTLRWLLLVRLFLLVSDDIHESTSANFPESKFIYVYK